MYLIDDSRVRIQDLTKENEMIQLLEEPRGVTYQQLISLAFSICDEFILVKRDQIELSGKGEEFLKEIKPYIKEIKKQDNWPGTQLFGHNADVYYLDCKNELQEILLTRADRLYAWMRPELLEDLCFYKNGEEWLITTAHEEMGSINTKESQDILKLREVEDIMMY